MKEVLKIENVVHSLVALLLVGGIITCSFYKDSPEIVSIASTLAFVGWLGITGFHRYQSSGRSKLFYAESVDISFLRQIRFLLQRRENIPDELIQVSASASNDADREYQNFYGFGRPLPATKSTNSQLKQ